MEEVKEKVGQEQIHDLLFKDSHSWQSIIYDLINTEQLDPWNVDIFFGSSRLSVIVLGNLIRLGLKPSLVICLLPKYGHWDSV
jgi:hypothetical protein